MALAPQPPLAGWLAELDSLTSRSPGFFAGRPILLDVSGLDLDKVGLTALIADLGARDIRIMGIEGADPSLLGLGMPPIVNSGRGLDPIETDQEADRPPSPGHDPAPPRNSLFLTDPVRSGQSVIFPQGDITIVGSVASGAEVVAGGSIHVYGSLRGRAVAGSTGNAKARIFCHRLEAELVAIDGFYLTAEEMDAGFRQRSVQTWLEGDSIKMATLN